MPEFAVKVIEPLLPPLQLTLLLAVVVLNAVSG